MNLSKIASVTAGKTKTSGEYWAMLGGLSDWKLGKYNQDGKSWWSVLNERKYFLTWHPVVKAIDENMPEKLYYLVFKEDTIGMKLKIKIMINIE